MPSDPHVDSQVPARHASSSERPRRGGCSTVSHQFEQWEAERAELQARLETKPRDREALLDRLFEIERLILETPSGDLVALRAKSHLLAWLMETEQADGLSAMRHIRDFFDSRSHDRTNP